MLLSCHWLSPSVLWQGVLRAGQVEPRHARRGHQQGSDRQLAPLTLCDCEQSATPKPQPLQRVYGAPTLFGRACHEEERTTDSIDICCCPCGRGSGSCGCRGHQKCGRSTAPRIAFFWCYDCWFARQVLPERHRIEPCREWLAARPSGLRL